MSRRLRRFGALALVIGWITAPYATAQAASWGREYLPNVPVLDQNGESLRFYDDVVRGKIAVFSFIYTSCRDICPVVTARLAQVQDRLGDAVGRNIFFVSVSIDPENDTPEKLKDYAQAFGAGPGWKFITGKPADMDLLRYKLGERSRKLSEHGNTIMLYNDATSEWARDSAFSDLDVLAINIQSMEPDRRGAAGLPMGVQSESGPATPAGMPADPGRELPGQSLFIKTCAACHTVGRGQKVGPDLAGISARRTRDWLVRYIVSPQSLRREGDPTALALGEQYRAVRMPVLSLSETDATDVLAYVDAMSYAAAATRADVQDGHRGHH